MSDKGKCDWCGLVFDYIKYKPKVVIDDTGDVLCEDCYTEYMNNKIINL